MKTVKILQVKTEAAAHVVIRSRTGRKLFDIYLPGVSITIAIPPDAEIKVVPKGSR